VNALLAIGAVVLGVLIVIWSTERLLDGMVGLAGLLRVAPLVIAGIFSGLEAENVAVGVVAARDRHSEIALGTVWHFRRLRRSRLGCGAVPAESDTATRDPARAGRHPRARPASR
jgi:hypothetical protein